MPVADFMCDCGYEEDTIVYKVGKYPDCPECGAVLVRDYKYGINLRIKGDGYGSFVPIDMGVLGYCDTKDKYDAACATIRQRYPGAEINVERETQAQKTERLDEHRHKVAQERRRKNVDDQAIKAARQESRRALRMGASNDEVVKKSANELVSPGSNTTIHRSPTRPKLAGKSRVLAG
jgi:hypothetical protein